MVTLLFVAQRSRDEARLRCGKRRGYRGSRDRDVLIDLGSLAAHANGADDFSVNGNGHAALQGHRAMKRESGDAAIPDLLFEDFARPAVDGRRARLVDADV